MAQTNLDHIAALTTKMRARACICMEGGWVKCFARPLKLWSITNAMLVSVTIGGLRLQAGGGTDSLGLVTSVRM